MERSGCLFQKVISTQCKEHDWALLCLEVSWLGEVGSAFGLPSVSSADVVSGWQLRAEDLESCAGLDLIVQREALTAPDLWF